MTNIALHDRQVLIVDDNENIRKALIYFLTLQGYDCVAANDGASALQLLNTDRFHLVITDYQMPAMDGLQLLEALKEHPTHDRQPVILMTADMSETLRRHALGLGAYAVIAKPFGPQELAALSARALESREIGQSRLRGRETIEMPT